MTFKPMNTIMKTNQACNIEKADGYGHSSNTLCNNMANIRFSRRGPEVKTKQLGSFISQYPLSDLLIGIKL